ncbi:MAG TPA: nucleotidyltransferase domain-containing protein [Syntrophorhabdaceae bacterium]|jgi:predicted nucleotidyltransferase|nr:nucleotidyltransferase domain-containing protein [Syntrophorhabdaceae bacterium]HQJ95311.1 nucleotidyltransferase domain-containing protein [Syntrophorhabdaceae bacterium]
MISSNVIANYTELIPLTNVLSTLKNEGKIPIAILYGSFAKGNPHPRSDIDLAVYPEGKDENEVIDIIDTILMSVERDISILRLDDEDESPFIVQEALKGIHLVEPDRNILYEIIHRVLHESESIRYRRNM